MLRNHWRRVKEKATHGKKSSDHRDECERRRAKQKQRKCTLHFFVFNGGRPHRSLIHFCMFSTISGDHGVLNFDIVTTGTVIDAFGASLLFFPDRSETINRCPACARRCFKIGCLFRVFVLKSANPTENNDAKYDHYVNSNSYFKHVSGHWMAPRGIWYVRW